ncbi:hypothetical protein [Vibrio alginolyticus]|uniref:hypothetical protein n=1 Tax=Vibrio alginolyticus TaxID=663 RepID=UPI0006CA7757|nr:hypothetical protein [Vibrio alginolyticus]CAH7370849.1 conserved hypothetical protein [Vibrio chagasii]
MNEFRNITCLGGNRFQVKLKHDKKDIQVSAIGLRGVLMTRNLFYTAANYRPRHLHLPQLDESAIRPFTRQEKSGNVYTRYQLHHYQIENRKYTPVSFSNSIEAIAFAKPWIRAYNAVAARYNGIREESFLEAIELEVETLTPHIEVGVNIELWNQCARDIFGNNIPAFTRH